MTTNGTVREQLIANMIMSRAELVRSLVDGGKDLDRDCGYPGPDAVNALLYQRLYDREAIATRVVEVYPKESWQVQPTLYEDEDPDVITAFEEAWDDLGRTLRGETSYHQDEAGSPLWEYLLRADILSGIGQYGVILLGLDDGLPLHEPAQVGKGKSSRKLTFIRIFPESAATIASREEDTSSPRLGQPLTYNLMFDSPMSSTGAFDTTTALVHWSRVIHVADNLAANEVFGVPRMQPVLNRLLDLRKLYGGSAEMYWRGAFPGYSLETNPNLGTEVDVDEEQMRGQMRLWADGLQRHIFLTGMSMKGLAPQVVDPRSQVEVQIEAICVQLGVPVRVFKGSERGELASSQDDAAWNDRLRQRQAGYVTPRIIVPFCDRLIQLGVLPTPEGYSIWWPDLTSQSEQEKTTIATGRTEAVVKYADSQGAKTVMAPMDFLTRVLGYSEEEASAIVENAEAEKAKMEEEAKAKAEEEAALKAQEMEKARELAEAQARANGTISPEKKGGEGDDDSEGGSPDTDDGDDEPPGGGRPTGNKRRRKKRRAQRSGSYPFDREVRNHLPGKHNQASHGKHSTIRAKAKRQAKKQQEERDRRDRGNKPGPGRGQTAGAGNLTSFREGEKVIARRYITHVTLEGRSRVFARPGDKLTVSTVDERGAVLVTRKDGATTQVTSIDVRRQGSGKEYGKGTTIRNTFCPTGQGGGIDPRCSPGGARSRKPIPRHPDRERIGTDVRPDRPAFHTPFRLEVEDKLRQALGAEPHNVFFGKQGAVTWIEGPRQYSLYPISKEVRGGKEGLALGSGDVGDSRKVFITRDDPPDKVRYAILRVTRQPIPEELRRKYGKGKFAANHLPGKHDQASHGRHSTVRAKAARAKGKPVKGRVQTERNRAQEAHDKMAAQVRTTITTSKGEFIVASLGSDTKELHREIEKVMGKGKGLKDALELTAAEGKGSVYFEAVPGGGVGIFMDTDDYSMGRQYLPRGVVRNDGLIINTEAQNKGLGTRLFVNQVESASAAGFKKMTTEASRSESREPLVGYNVWPKMGYDGKIPREVSGILPPELARARKVSDLMKTEAGRAWWKEHGQSTEMEFDLRPDSRSRKVLTEYLNRKRGG